MDISCLKEKIIDNDYIPVILQELGCHHISRKSGWYSCGNPDGDNTSAITVYMESLVVVDYTRNIKTNSSSADIFDLVQFFQKCTFFEAIKYVCQWCEIDYYSDDYDKLPESIKFTQLMEQLMDDDVVAEEVKPIKPIPEKILSYYSPAVNDMFKNDNIPYNIQQIFEIGYDSSTNRITIPIRDEFGTLVGIKGRTFLPVSQMTEQEKKTKYLYIESCNRARLLYGLYISEPTIKRLNTVYVTEAEKGVMQLWGMGIENCVATCGKKISQCQIEMLTRLCSHIIFCFDKDVDRDELTEIAGKFIDCIEIKALIDTDNILAEKESPTDNKDKFHKLLSSYCETIRGAKHGI